MIHLYGLNFGHRPDLSYYREIVNVFMIHGHFPISFSLALAPKQERQSVLDKKVSFFGYNQVSITRKGASCSQIHTVNSYTTPGCHTPDRGTWISEQRCQVLLQDQSLNKQL